MQDGYQDDYSDFIFMYPVSSLPKDKQQEGGSFDRAIEKSAKAIKQHSIKAKPEKKPGKSRDPKYQSFMNREEYNPFLHNAWMLMGKAQFQNGDFLVSSSTFSYIARHYTYDDPKIVTNARIWQARSYAELGWLYEAEDILRKIDVQHLEKDEKNWYSSIYADYLIKNKEYREAVPYLNTAIKAEKNKTQKNRMKYLLGQIYTSLDQKDLAYKTFGEVAGSTAPYPLTFSAQIRQTEVFPGGNTSKIIGKLKKMTKDPKNKDYQDQVYYAMGNIYLSVPDTIHAIESYRKGSDKELKGGMDKALCQIKLGDIFFNQRKYIEAQPCYSEALGALKKENKDYERVSKRSEILDELVVHYENVHLQDSLQILAAMPEAERMAVINKIIEKVKKEEKEAKEKEEKEELMAQAEQSAPDLSARKSVQPPKQVPSGSPSDNAFYFYNPQTVSSGKISFQSKWGRRKLEDNWRRKNKSQVLDSGFDSYAEKTDTIDKQQNLPDQQDAVSEKAAGEESNDPKNPQYYLQQIPMTPEDIASSNAIIIDGLYNMALIFKDKLEDIPLAIETFDKLNNRFPDNEFLLDSYYQLYLSYLRLGDKDMYQSIKNKIIAEFPESDYAIAMADPNYEYNVRMMDVIQDSLYEDTYRNYLDGKALNVRKNYKLVQERYSQTKLMPKFMFLNALSYIQTNQPEEFRLNIKDLAEKYPEADVGILAENILKDLIRGRQLSSDTSPMKGMIFNLRFGSESGEMAIADSTIKFSEETKKPYQMMLIYPTGKINQNQMLYDIAAYNFNNFVIKDFDLSFDEFGDISMMQIKGFDNFDEILQYYKMINMENGYVKKLSRDIVIVPISVENYEILMRGKTLEEYMTFFEKHFGKQNPAMIAKWKLKQQEETEKAVKEEAEKFLEELESDSDSIDTIETGSPTPIIKDSVRQESKPVITPEQKKGSDSISIAPKPIITEKEVEDGLNKAAEGASKTIDAVNETLKDIQNNPVEGIKKLFSRKKQKNEIDIYVEQQEKEEKEQQKLLKEQKEAEEKAQKELLKQQEKERKTLLKKQKEEEDAILKAKEQQEKTLQDLKKQEEKERQDAIKQKERDRKEAQELKEKAYKERQKQKEEARKAKEKAYKEEQKRKAEQRELLRKQREEARKAAQQKKETEKKK